MKSRDLRVAVGLGSFVCALVAVYTSSGLRLRADSPPPRQNLPADGGVLNGTRAPVAQNQEPTTHAVRVTASRYKFDPPLIEVFQDDLVKVELHTDDIAHSLT